MRHTWVGNNNDIVNIYSLPALCQALRALYVNSYNPHKKFSVLTLFPKHPLESKVKKPRCVEVSILANANSAKELKQFNTGVTSKP